MRVVELGLPGVRLLEQDLHRDARGWFVELWRARGMADARLPGEWAQCSLSHSHRGVLRGLHLQHPSAQSKLVAAVSGTIFDVAADVRRGSPTFGRWVGLELAADRGHQLFVPEGFAHGFLTLSETATVVYCVSTPYAPAAEMTIRWDDPDLGIHWPAQPTQLSPRDRGALGLGQLDEQLPVFRP